MKRITIAIDGYSSSGKSSMARQLAQTIGYRYIDSGAMYRAVTLYAMRHGFIATDGTLDINGLISSLPSVKIDFGIKDGKQYTLLNGENVEEEIRSMPVSNNVSSVAAIPAIRSYLVAQQQAFGLDKGIVMDGRDIGTTVFPDAELKLFVTASAETRAQRRVKELESKGQRVNYEEVLANVVHRDHVDETRKESPLRRADDAVLLDNSNLSVSEQNAILLTLFNDRIKE